MTTTRSNSTNQLKDAYRRITDRASEAAIRAGRKPETVVMVAVTKTATPDQIRAVVEMGHIDLGENRVQQLVQRAAQLDEFVSRRRMLGRAAPRPGDDELPNVRWHMIGHLQRNKVKQVLPIARLIHSVDSLRLAEEIQSQAARMDQVAEVLLQVNAGGEAQKSGVAAPAARHLAEQMDTMMNLRLRGLMCMAPFTDDKRAIEAAFARTSDIFSDIRDAKIGGSQFSVLSMGMSEDFELAIAYGANVIRIGRALFGEGEA